MASMIKTFETIPNWAGYNEAKPQTAVIKSYWESDKNGGGMITNSITSPKIEFITSPLMNLMYNLDSGKYYEIKKIKKQTNLNVYLDVWISTSNLNDLAALQALESSNGLKCCWDDDVKNNFNGFMRGIEYYSEDGQNIDYATRIWEGEVTKGIPNGFIRIIDAVGNYNFIGYSKDWNSRYGTGLFFEDNKLTEMGFYYDDSENKYEKMKFKEFRSTKAK